jgi:hypothetical protein
MVLDLGFLGDTVHLLPALWMVRRAYPQAELHVAVAEHITSFMECAPPEFRQVAGNIRGVAAKPRTFSVECPTFSTPIYAKGLTILVLLSRNDSVERT